MVYFQSIALSFVTIQVLAHLQGAHSLQQYDLSDVKTGGCSDGDNCNNMVPNEDHFNQDNSTVASASNPTKVISVTTKQLQQIGLSLSTNATIDANAISYYRKIALAKENYAASSNSTITTATTATARITIDTTADTTTDATTTLPVPSSNLKTAPQKAIPSSTRLPPSLGLYHTCTIDKSKHLNCWGFNSFGQVGNDSTRNVRTPTRIIEATATSHVTQVVLGYQHTCAIDNLNELYCWGENTDGQIGDNSNTNRLIPTHIAPPSSSSSLFAFVALGSRHTCALDAENDLYCWGDNAFGQLGNGSSKSHLTPTIITHPATETSSSSASKFVKLALGDFHTCAIDDANDLYCWGYNFRGQLGDNSNNYFSRRPTLIAPPVTTTGTSSFVEIALGRWHTCALDTENDLYCWGGNDEGELGNNSDTDRAAPTLVTHPTNSNSSTRSSFFVQVSLGAYYTCAIDNTNDLYCWGANERGQVGDNGNTHRLVPTLIPHPAKNPSTKFVEVTLGEYHTCALDSSNDIYCWGSNDYSQLGDGSNVQYRTPTHIADF